MATRINEKGERVRSVRCGNCWETGHNKLSCPDRREKLPEQVKEHKKLAKEHEKDSWDYNYHMRRSEDYKAELDKMVNRGKNRTCGYCDNSGHNRATCSDRKSETKRVADETIALRKFAARSMEESGFGIGSLVQIGIRTSGSIEEPVMAVVTGVQFDQLYSTEHKYTGGSYFYPPQLIDYQLVRPQKSNWDDSYTTHGKAYMPVEFLNPDHHEVSEDSSRRDLPVLLSDVTCSGLLPPEAIDFDVVSKYVRDEYVDPRKK